MRIDMNTVENPMTQAEGREWVEALRSGKYKQGLNSLETKTLHFEPAYCCLGVERKVHPEQCAGVTSYLFLQHRFTGGPATEVRLPNDVQSVLSTMNDKSSTFEEVADFIETEILPNLPESV